MKPHTRPVDYKRMRWQNRAHFMAPAAQAMRRILVDHARRRNVKVVELRFFAGLSVEETAEVLSVSPITVMREWQSAKAWLCRELAGPTADGQ